jgi:hypothetical protein
MDFIKNGENDWEAIIIFKNNRFFGYGITKQEAGSNCFSSMQKYIDEMQEALNENIK